MTDTTLPRGISHNGDGRYLARRTRQGHRQRRTFDTVPEAIAWREQAETSDNQEALRDNFGHRYAPISGTPTPAPPADKPNKTKPNNTPNKAPTPQVADEPQEPPLPKGITKRDRSNKPYQVRITRKKQTYIGSFATLEHAEAWIEAIERALVSNQPVPPPDSVYTPTTQTNVVLFGEAVNEWYPRYIAEKRASKQGILPSSAQAIRNILDDLVLPTFANRVLRRNYC